MDKVNRRSFLEKAGVTLAAGSVPAMANAAGGAGAGKASTEGKPHDAEDPSRFGIARCVVEWSYNSGKAYADPFNDVELDVVFTDPQGHEQTVPAFWAGEQTWRIRYSPLAAGRYTYRTVASDQGDLHGRRGVLEVSAYEGDNPLRKHGPMRVAADQRHFEHDRRDAFLLAGRHVVDGPMQPDALAGRFRAVGGGPREERLHGDSNHRRAVSGHAAFRPAGRKRSGISLGRGIRAHQSRLL